MSKVHAHRITVSVLLMVEPDDREVPCFSCCSRSLTRTALRRACRATGGPRSDHCTLLPNILVPSPAPHSDGLPGATQGCGRCRCVTFHGRRYTYVGTERGSWNSRNTKCRSMCRCGTETRVYLKQSSYADIQATLVTHLLAQLSRAHHANCAIREAKRR